MISLPKQKHNRDYYIILYFYEIPPAFSLTPDGNGSLFINIEWEWKEELLTEYYVDVDFNL